MPSKSTPTVATCDLCGLRLNPDHTIEWHHGEHPFFFCCHGCRQVFGVLMAATGTADPQQFKQSDLYRRCQAMGIIPGSQEELEERIAAAAPPLSPETATPGETPQNVLRLDLTVDNMWCPACAWIIEEALNKMPGIAHAACHFSTDRLTCDYDPLRQSPQKVIRTIRQLGYAVGLNDAEEKDRQRRSEFVRFAVSAFFTMNVMMLSFALYVGFFSDLGVDNIRKIAWPMGIMASIVLFYGGFPIYRRALAGFTTAVLSMETLISVGAFSAYGYSLINFYTGSIHLYFDTTAMLVTLVLLGKTLERRAKGRVQRYLDAILARIPTKVNICSDAFPQGRYVAAAQLQPSDTFRVAAGEIVAADGRVLDGRAELDESSLTGEAEPVVSRPGDAIRGGSLVLRGQLTVQAEAVGGDTVMGQLTHIIENALQRKTPLESKADRLLRGFVPTIIVLAILTAGGGWLAGLEPHITLLRALTVLVIACPCALGIAIPLARVAGISVAGQHGVLVRDFQAFEKADQIDTLVFDKTGTLTAGHWRLKSIQLPGSLDRSEVIALAAGLERDAEHPVGRRLVQAAQEADILPADINAPEVHANGVSGMHTGRVLKLGSAVFTRCTDHQLSGTDPADSPVYLTVDDQPAAVFIFGDSLKPGSRTAIETLIQRNYALALVSGDNAVTTQTVGQALGLTHSKGQQLPRQKAAYVETLQNGGRRVAMVGDGINDAPAMAQADLALAMYGGSHLGKETADVTLMQGEPAQLIGFLALARRVTRTVRQNLVCAFGYNLIAIPVAMAGWLNPLVAVCAMLLSSLSVIGNTLRLLRYRV